MDDQLCDERYGNVVDFMHRLEKKQDSILFILNGNGRLGVVGKLTVLWGVSTTAGIAAVVALVRTLI